MKSNNGGKTDKKDGKLIKKWWKICKKPNKNDKKIDKKSRKINAKTIKNNKKIEKKLMKNNKNDKKIEKIEKKWWNDKLTKKINQLINRFTKVSDGWFKLKCSFSNN